MVQHKARIKIYHLLVQHFVTIKIYPLCNKWVCLLSCLLYRVTALALLTYSSSKGCLFFIINGKVIRGALGIDYNISYSWPALQRLMELRKNNTLIHYMQRYSLIEHPNWHAWYIDAMTCKVHFLRSLYVFKLSCWLRFLSLYLFYYAAIIVTYIEPIEDE